MSILVRRGEPTTVAVLIEQGADVFQTNSKGEAIIYLSKKLAENDPDKFGPIHRLMRQNLRVNYNSTNLSTIQF